MHGQKCTCAAAESSFMAYFIYANNEPKSVLARDLGDCRDNKGKLAKRVFTCLIALNVVYMENDRKKGLSSIKDSDLFGQKVFM